MTHYCPNTQWTLQRCFIRLLRFLLNHAHCRAVHNSEGMESACVNISWWVDTENVIHRHGLFDSPVEKRAIRKATGKRTKLGEESAPRLRKINTARSFPCVEPASTLATCVIHLEYLRRWVWATRAGRSLQGVHLAMHKGFDYRGEKFKKERMWVEKGDKRRRRKVNQN